jgi:hypothetical protein
MNSTDVCNMALGMIGQNFIVAIDDGTHTANQCKLFYEPSRDACLRDHKWNFAQKRQALAQTTSPASGWSYAYTLPPDCVRVVELNGTPELQWAVEGRALVTDEPAATILFIAKSDDVNLWDALFVDAFTTLLASKLALAVAHDAQYSAQLLGLYQSRYGDAKAVDGQEAGTPDALGAPDLIDVRNAT